MIMKRRSRRVLTFVLRNLVNSGLESVYVLAQYRAQSLLDHVQRGWAAAPGGVVVIGKAPETPFTRERGQ